MIARTDISVADQVCQIAHAAHEAGIHLSQQKERISSIVVCVVENEQELLKAHDRINKYGIKTILFREPDMGNEATAFASEPLPSDGSARKYFSRYKLWKGDAHA